MNKLKYLVLVIISSFLISCTQPDILGCSLQGVAGGSNKCYEGVVSE